MAVIVGGALVVAGCLGIWHAAIISNGLESGRRIGLSFFLAIFALVRGVVILSWNRRTEPMVLMRVQAADALLGILPLAFFASSLLSMPVPELADPAQPYLWMAGLVLASAAFSVVPAEEAALLEIPPLRPGRYLDWLRWQNFGAGTLLFSVLVPVMYFSYPLQSYAFAPLIVVLALAQATVSVWRIIEHRQLSKAGVHLSGLQISWLRVIHIKRGHEAAVKELRTMYPKISPLQAGTIIENLYRTEEQPTEVA
ncbi:hypothetical protein [Arthrobacter sp. SPG23]|uniref:hypothetical protein n=1 Tax=Arthrobacter sp. SPG23 TaxID=1610703 RepID=UPI0011854543|nr:hypothetical protein [Arthrobacter sp. SPG23]